TEATPAAFRKARFASAAGSAVCAHETLAIDGIAGLQRTHAAAGRHAILCDLRKAHEASAARRVGVISRFGAGSVLRAARQRTAFPYRSAGAVLFTGPYDASSASRAAA